MRKASKSAVSNLITYGIVIAAYIICQVLIENGQMTRALKGQLVPICVYGFAGRYALIHPFVCFGYFQCCTRVVIPVFLFCRHIR